MKCICPKCNHEFMSKDNTIKILNLIKRNGTKQISEIAEELKISRPTVYHHIKKLKEMNLIETFKIKLIPKLKGDPTFVKIK